MSNIIPFDFNGNQVRTFVGEDGEPWFIAKDVAAVLGYRQTDKAVRDHAKYLILLRPADLAGLGIKDPNPYGMGIIPEQDVYRLVFRSKLPEAERFEEWVVGEVLPQLRKKGSYSLTNTPAPTTGEMFVEMADAFRRQEKELEDLRNRTDKLEAEQDRNGNKMSAMGYLNYYNLDAGLQISKKLGHRGTKLSRKYGRSKEEVRDPRFGKVGLYDLDILDQAWEELVDEGRLVL